MNSILIVQGSIKKREKKKSQITEAVSCNIDFLITFFSNLQWKHLKLSPSKRIQCALLMRNNGLEAIIIFIKYMLLWYHLVINNIYSMLKERMKVIYFINYNN